MSHNPWNVRAAKGFVRSSNFNRPWYKYGYNLLEAHIDQPSDHYVLDVGCGVGEFLEILSHNSFKVTGIDGNPEQVSVVRSHGFPAEVVDLEEELPFPDQSFDIVVCLEVVEHIACAENLVKEIHRVLKHGGVFLVSTPNFSYLNWRLHYLLGDGPVNEGIHLRFFTSLSLRSLLQKVGFNFIAQNSYGPIPVVSSIMLHIFKQAPPLWCVSSPLESIFALDLIYLVEKS